MEVFFVLDEMPGHADVRVSPTSPVRLEMTHSITSFVVTVVARGDENADLPKEVAEKLLAFSPTAQETCR